MKTAVAVLQFHDTFELTRHMTWNEECEEKAAQPLFKQGMRATQDDR